MIRIAINNPSPLGANLEKWGDYHFGLALAAALSAQGAQVTQRFWPEWDRDDGEDLVIVLRGKRSFRPPAGKLALMWVISHPATVTAEEMHRYDRVLVASETHYQMVRNDPGISVDIARQCTDTTVFRHSTAASDRRGVSFVANSRGVRREILNWAAEAGVRVDVTGRHWKALGLQHLVVRDYISNADLPAFYGATRLTLNDHWGDMSHYGYINNRIFDCLACGTPILTDHFPELRAVCGDGLLYAQDSVSFWEAYRTFLLRYPEVIENTARLWSEIGPRYSFAARAAQILDWAGARPAPRPRESASAPSGYRPVIDDLMARLRGAGIAREVQCLHMFPEPGHGAELFQTPELNYLSGGMHPGPWHLVMDPSLSSLADGTRDLILIDDLAWLTAAAPEEVTAFFAAAARKLSAGGMIVAPAAVSGLAGLEGRALMPLPGGYARVG